MKLFSATLYDASRRWYLSLPDSRIKTMDRLEEVFLKRWSIKEDPNMILTQLNNLSKYENEFIQEFHNRFETLLQNILAIHHPKDDYLVQIYTKYFSGQLGYLFRDKNPQSIQEAQEIATRIQDNLLSSKIEPFANLRGKVDTKLKIVHNTEPTSDLCAYISKLQSFMDGIIKNQEHMMSRIVNLERSQIQAPRVPYKGQFPKGNQFYKPKNEQEVPNILAPTNVVNENPWCLECSEAHWEHGFSYNDNKHQQVKNIGHLMEGPQINITTEEHQEAIREAVRKYRMAVIKNLDQESKEKLKRQEFQVYRRKKLRQPTTDQTKPPPLDVLLPKAPKMERVDLNFDFEGALSKIHVTIPLREVIKVPSVKERFDNFFQTLDGPMDPPIMLHADHFRVQYGEKPPFFMTLVMKNKSLNNCMLDIGAGANIIPFKVMKQLGLKVTRPYMNVCGFKYKAIPTHGVVENVEICLKEYPEKVIHLDIMIVYVPYVWGMLLSRKFSSMLGDTLKMDLSFIELPLKDEIIGRLLNEPVTETHVQEANHPVKSDKAHDEIIQTLHKFSPEDMPFATEEDFDKIKWPKREEYQKILDEFKDKETETVKILKKLEDDVQIHPSQQEVFTTEAHPPPSLQYTRVVQGTTKYKIRKYKEGYVVWMWDIQKGEPTNVKGSTQSWLRPFKVGCESVDDSYYLSTLE
jgi:hypothetical protein